MGGMFEDAVNSFFASVIDQIMTFIWAAAINLLRGSFELVDGLLGFGDGSDLTSGAAPFAEIWPLLRWIGVSVALGLFFWQLITTMMRGGAGFWRAATGPVAYGVATAMTLGVVAALLGAAEGLTTVLLQQGLQADSFRTILDNPDLAFTDNPEVDSQLDSSVRAMLLGLVALFGVIPAALGFALQMIFRHAAILVLAATVPITAAGLMTNTTASWFWRSLRWMLAAILMKPALALVLVIGINVLSAPTGVGGLLAGTGILLISLFCPLVLFRLLAFVEPGTNAGATLRSASRGGGAGGQPSASSSPEETNAARFDSAQSGGGGFSGPGPASSGGGGGAAGGGAAGAGAAGAGGGGAASGAAAGGGAGAAGGGAAGGAGGGALGVVGAASAAVGAAASFATGFASSTMDATGIGTGQGGGSRGGSGGGSRGRGERGGSDGGGGYDDGYDGVGGGGDYPGDGASPPDPGPSGEGGDGWDPDDDGGDPRGWDGERIGEQRPPDRATQGPRSGGRGGGAGGGGAGGGGAAAGGGGAGAGGAGGAGAGGR